METKIYSEHRFVLAHEGLHYDVTVRTSAPTDDYQFTSQGLQPIYGDPFITVKIGEEWMPYGKINGDPEISERAARDYVQQKLITWEQLGLFGAHLSREAAARRAMGRRNES